MADDVFLGIPTYDEWVHINCMTGVIHASAKRQIKMQMIGSSALPFAFNQLWCSGIMSGAEYFAMMHADVGPSGYWADVLIEEMEEHQADIMSATIPIKDACNVYSTALAHPGQAAHYRLTQEHYEQLPDTYGDADVRRVSGESGALCVNTGLWVCRMDRPWVKQVHFEFVTGIDWSGDKPRCTFIPEDWQLSHMVTRLGGTVMGTKKVQLTHAGNYVWRTMAPRPRRNKPWIAGGDNGQGSEEMGGQGHGDSAANEASQLTPTGL